MLITPYFLSKCFETYVIIWQIRYIAVSNDYVENKIEIVHDSDVFYALFVFFLCKLVVKKCLECN